VWQDSRGRLELSLGPELAQGQVCLSPEGSSISSPNVPFRLRAAVGSNGERWSRGRSRHSPAERRVPRKTCLWMGISSGHAVLGCPHGTSPVPLPWHRSEVSGKAQGMARAGGGQARGFRGVKPDCLLNQGSRGGRRPLGRASRAKAAPGTSRHEPGGCSRAVPAHQRAHVCWTLAGAETFFFHQIICKTQV